jgi:HNH endonuclease
VRNVNFEDSVLNGLRHLTDAMGPIVKDFTKKYFYTSDNETKNNKRDPCFRANLFQFYYNESTTPFHIQCMFTGVDIPATSIIASHIFKFKFRNDCNDLLNFEDINHERNGLLLFLPIEHAFDRSHITFIYNKDISQFVLKLLKPGLSELTFRDYIKKENDVDTTNLFKENYAKKKQSKVLYVSNLKKLLDQKFGDFEGKPFAYKFTTSKCYYRCLAFQQSMAMLYAEKEKWIEKDDVKSPSMWSDMGDENIAAVSAWIERIKGSTEPMIEYRD